MGNPTRDGTWSYTWKHGRELVSMSDGTTTWTYTYDADGMRTKRTNGTNTYTYVYNGSHLTVMTKGDDTLQFTYDASGTPLAVIYNGVTYYYHTNLQGDILGIKDGSGNAVVTYAYDAWGKLLSTTGTMADSFGAVNPLRYRGYVYDSETALYYLQSRYYNPEWGRFINADGLIDIENDPNGTNIFLYCGNNPIIRIDSNGYFWTEIWEYLKGVGTEIVNTIEGLSGTYSQIGQIAITDGSLPVADAIAVAGAAALTVGAIAYSVVTATKKQAIAIPKLEIKQKQKTKQYQYWQADRINKTVVLGRGLTLTEASIRVAMGFDVMCASRDAARTLLFINGYWNSVGPEIHGGEGFYWHYHPHRHTHTHIWYYS